jgi:hypothetical protein
MHVNALVDVINAVAYGIRLIEIVGGPARTTSTPLTSRHGTHSIVTETDP